jgi:hypothetical protein
MFWEDIVKKGFVLIILGLLSCGLVVYAHHSFAGTYLMDKTREVEGRVAQVQIRNPHSFFHVEVVGEGQTVRWLVEGAGATQMRESPLKVGDHVKVTGNPGRSADSNRLRLIHIIRPSDGWSWGDRPGQVVD